MHTPKNTAFFACVLATLFLLTAPVQAAIKCWTNKDGVRECGNVVPPEYSQESHTTISNTGVTTGVSEAAKTPEELAAEKRAAEEKAKKEALAKKKAAADRVLLDTFASEDDLIMTRDGKIANIESEIKLTEGHIEKLRKNLDEIIAQAADIERRGGKPGDKVKSDIENVRKQIEDNEAFIEKKKAEQEAVRKQFDADLVRFRELKGKTSTSEEPAP